MMRGKIIILAAPSGAGKTTLAHALLAKRPEARFSVSHTTRPPRPGEQHGVDYYFVKPDEFQEMVAAGRFLEHAKVFDHDYGTSRAVVMNMADQGNEVLLDIDWQGAQTVKQLIPEAISIFILPPSQKALRDRLLYRGQDKAEVVERRMRDAVTEMGHYVEFDHVIVNDEIELALADLNAIIDGRPEEARPLGLDMEALLAES